MSDAKQDKNDGELEARADGVLERGLGSAWEQLAPLSVGAVVSAAAIVGATKALRRTLGPSRRMLGWAGAVALIPIGYWLLSDAEDGTEREPAPSTENESE
jgi:hypothetical protein